MKPLRHPSHEFDVLFDRAAHAFETGPKGNYLLSNENISRVENILPLLAAALNHNTAKLRMSHNRVQIALRNELGTRLGLKRPAEDFNAKYRDFQKMLVKLPLETYQIAFPLPLITTLNPPPSWTLGDLTFAPLDWKDWDGLTKTAGVNLVDLLKRNRHELDAKGFTPYTTKVQARDGYFAVQHTVDTLETTLGMVNYAAFYGRGYPMRIGGSGSQRWSDLRHPFIFLAKRPDNSVMVWREDDEGHRRPFRLEGSQLQRYQQVFPQIPALDHADRFDSVILAAFQHNQRAMTAPTFSDIFSHFWRGIEALALTQAREPSGTNMEHMAGLIGYADEQPLLNLRLHRMAMLRNGLVHIGTSEPIDDSDLNFMSGTLAAAIDAFLGTRGKYSLEDLRYMMEQSADVKLLDRRAALLRDIVKWRMAGERKVTKATKQELMPAMAEEPTAVPAKRSSRTAKHGRKKAKE